MNSVCSEPSRQDRILAYIVGRHFMVALILIAFGLCSQACAKTEPNKEAINRQLAESIETTQRDVKKAAKELNDLRDEISDKRVPLALEMEKLQADVISLRRDAQRLRNLRYQGEQQYQSLRDEVESDGQELHFLYTLLSEYRRSLETRAGISETRLLASDMEKVDCTLTDKDDYNKLPSAAKMLLNIASRWNRKKLGGLLFEGVCLDSDGIELCGRFAVLGPIAYFVSDKGNTAGIVVSRLGSSGPSVYERITTAARQQIKTLVSGEKASVPVDVTSGDALKVQAARESLTEHVKSGGIVMIPLLAIGVIALTLSIQKFVSLSRLRADPSLAMNQVLELLEKGQVDQAKAQAMKTGEPVGPILLEGIEHRAAPKEHLEEIMHERVLICIPFLERHLGVLAVLGGIAPLLGLLGTVTGMIHTFQLVTIFGSGDAKLLSGGISEALVTTETGLMIAIPVLLIHAYLSRRVRTLIGALEQTVIGFVNRLKVRRAVT